MAARSVVVRLMPGAEDSSEWESMIYDSLTAATSARERRRQRRSLLRAAPRALAGAWVRQVRVSLRRVLG